MTDDELGRKAWSLWTDGLPLSATWDDAQEHARAAMTRVALAVRDAALEEAAAVCDREWLCAHACNESCAAAIRALKAS